jgi:hypothetical protein
LTCLPYVVRVTDGTTASNHTRDMTMNHVREVDRVIGKPSQRMSELPDQRRRSIARGKGKAGAGSSSQSIAVSRNHRDR